jgi:hypothetical protein
MADKERELIVLESWRFTSLSAFARELTHLLEHSDYLMEAHVREIEIERMAAELGAIRAMGRLKVKVAR